MCLLLVGSFSLPYLLEYAILQWWIWETSISVFFFFHWNYNPPDFLWDHRFWFQTVLHHVSLLVANLLQPLIPGHDKSSSTSSYHLFLSLWDLLTYGTHSRTILLVCLKLSILSMWPTHLICWALIKFIIVHPFINSLSSLFVVLFHIPFSNVGPQIHCSTFF